MLSNLSEVLPDCHLPRTPMTDSGDVGLCSLAMSVSDDISISNSAS